MRLLTAMRRNQVRASRLVTALLAVTWLGLATAPCQAAPDPGHVGSSHHGSMPAGDCGHCPLTDSGPDSACASVAGTVCQVHSPALLEQRDVDNLKLQASSPHGFPDFDALVPSGGFSLHVGTGLPIVPRVSIQQRYCTYLK